MLIRLLLKGDIFGDVTGIIITVGSKMHAAMRVSRSISAQMTRECITSLNKAMSDLW